MNLTRKLLLLGTLALPASAFANEGGHIDGYYIPSSTLEFDVPNEGSSKDNSGDGGGVKAFVPLGYYHAFFLEGEYQSVDLHNFNYDVDQLRLGAGWQSPVGFGTLGLYGEYVKIKLDGSDADGFGAHVRLAMPVARGAQVYGQVGYVHVEDDSNNTIDGPEFLIGASLDFARNVGAFIDYRYSDLEDDDNFKYKFGDLRLGIRLLFNS